MAEDTNDTSDRPGLGNASEKDWPTITKAMVKLPPIERLKPNSDLHKTVLKYLQDRIDLSERSMNKFYDRWSVNEIKYQAYINQNDYEQLLKDANNRADAPRAVNIVVPYSFATINTIVTYLIHTFAGRKPMFQVSSNRGDAVKAADNMEQMLQYNGEHTRLIVQLFQMLMDTQIYGVGILRTKWKEERKMRTIWTTQPKKLIFGLNSSETESVASRQERLTYQGNMVEAIDPFMFFPDPRVPMNQVNRRGEFVFWRTYQGKHDLKIAENAGELMWVDAGGELSEKNSNFGNNSARDRLSRGEANPGRDTMATNQMKNFMRTEQGTVVIIPNELGLGSGGSEDDMPKKYLFTILNGRQIVQAEEFTADHDMHPVCVTEPYGMGYGFGQAGISDYLGPMQDLMSWFINSHVDNVRTSLNNMWLVDPSRVEMQDLKKPGAGKLIRLKRSAYGQDIRQIVTQFPVQDVTGNHIKDFQVLMQMTDAMSSITDNLRGLQDDGGRKTATEVRTAGEAGASRLAAQTRIISAQSIVDLAEQMTLNIQQYMTDEFYITVMGPESMDTSIKIGPEQVSGDFNFPVHDGTLPLDRVAMLDVWQQIFQGVSTNPQLTGRFDLIQMFKYIAELGGARNIDQFIITGVPDGEIPPGNIPMGSGGTPPAPPSGPPGGGATIPPNPGARLAGAQ